MLFAVFSLARACHGENAAFGLARLLTTVFIWRGVIDWEATFH